MYPRLAFTQPKGVEFRYKSSYPDVYDWSVIEDERVRNIIEQRIKEDCQLYTLTVFGDKSLFTKDPASIVKMPLEVDYVNIYMDFDRLVKDSQIKYHDQLYLVSDSLITDEWNISDTLDTGESLVRPGDCRQQRSIRLHGLAGIGREDGVALYEFGASKHSYKGRRRPACGS